MTPEEIKVKNCMECPFVTSDNDYGYCLCNISDAVSESLQRWEELPSDKVHDLCPLKTNPVIVSLDPSPGAQG